MSRVTKIFLQLILISSVVLTTARGQSLGSLKGTVEDSTKAPVPDAKVRLRSQTTAKVLATTTDEDGEFEFEDLPLGQYLLTVESQGFEQVEKPVEVGATPARPLRIGLQLAQVKQQVTVSAKANSAVSVQENASAVQLDNRWLQNLPLQEGDPLAIPTLLLDPSAMGAQGPQLIVDGVESDGLEVPTSSIKAIFVNRSPYSAEFGRPGKGRIEVLTRQGSRHRYRGEVSLLLRNSDLDARNAFATERPPLQRAIAEAQLSGPLTRRVTFFIAGRYHVNNQAAVITAVTPSGPLVENFMGRERATHLFGRLDYAHHRHKLALVYRYKYRSERNQNVGGFNLPERATDEFDQENEFRIFETETVSDNFLNEARFTFKVQPQNTDSLSNQPAIIVQGFFTSGGAQVSQRQREKVANIQDVATVFQGKHTVRFGGGIRPRFIDSSDASNFGGTFTFSSLQTFAAGQPFLFTMNEGNPSISFTQKQFFSFIEDEVRLRPAVSFSLGLRYEFQPNVPRPLYGNLAPRFSLAYAPGSRRTVIRAGAGVFTDRQPPLLEQQALLYDGLRIRQTVIQDPAFPNPFGGPTPASFATPSVVRIAPDIRNPYLMQEGVSVERQLGAGRNSLTVEFTSLRGIGLYRMRNINAPLLGTGAPPDPNYININQFEATGKSRSNSLAITYQTTSRHRFDLLAQYTLSKSMDDTNGILHSVTSTLDLPQGQYTLFPANSYDLRGEWGRAALDRRHRFNLMTMYHLPFGFRSGAVLKLNSGIPYNITTGSDDNHDHIPNDRPPGVARNTGNGPGYADVDLHLAKEFKLPRVTARSKVEMGADAFNLFNRVNFKDFVGTLASPFFGRANAAHAARELQLSFRYRF